MKYNTIHYDPYQLTWNISGKKKKKRETASKSHYTLLPWELEPQKQIDTPDGYGLAKHVHKRPSLWSPWWPLIRPATGRFCVLVVKLEFFWLIKHMLLIGVNGL